MYSCVYDTHTICSKRYRAIDYVGSIVILYGNSSPNIVKIYFDFYIKLYKHLKIYRNINK